MVFLDHVQNLNIRAEKTHKDFGAHCMKYVNFVHDPEKQYRSTVPAGRPLSIGLQVTEYMCCAPVRSRSSLVPFAKSTRVLYKNVKIDLPCFYRYSSMEPAALF